MVRWPRNRHKELQDPGRIKRYASGCRYKMEGLRHRGAVTARGVAVGNIACVNHDSPPSSRDLLDLLRRIADHDDAPDTVQADAREYLRFLQSASSGSGSLTGEARWTMAASAVVAAEDDLDKPVTRVSVPRRHGRQRHQLQCVREP
jgi:hypothetical protein